MKQHVFKPSRRNLRTSKRVVSPLYSGRYRLPGDLKDTRIALGTKDQRVAEAKLAKIVREAEQERAGLLAPKALRDAANQSLPVFLDEYLAELERLGRAPKYVLGVRRQLELLAKECRWLRVGDVNADGFRAWRNAQRGKSAKTLNEYLTNAGAFLSWLEKSERLARNPLRSVQRIERHGESSHKRRALTDEEARRLISVHSPWAVAYQIALETGLRRNEVEQLEWRDLRLEGAEPFVLARSATTKNRKDTHLPCTPALAKSLQALRPAGVAPGDRVFPKPLPRMNRMRQDLAAAGIAPIDAQGRHVDFHALRHTFCTRLALANTPIQVAMKLMRHSDPKLTTQVYLDGGRLPTAEAVRALPPLVPTHHQSAPESALDLVPDGPGVSHGVQATPRKAELQPSKTQLTSPNLSLPVPQSPDNQNGARCRVRTCWQSLLR
ncbi:MAG: tyrosine recombinase XerC [Verrucomicrobiales bacterium]